MPGKPPPGTRTAFSGFNEAAAALPRKTDVVAIYARNVVSLQ